MDDDQLRLDLEDARARLARLAMAIAARDTADAKVIDLARQLKEAKRRAKEASWEVGACLSREREAILAVKGKGGKQC